MPAPSVQLSQALNTNVTASVSTGAGAFVSAAVDLQDYEGVVQIILNTGTITGSLSAISVTECATSGGSYTVLTQTPGGAFSVAAATVSSIYIDASAALRFVKFNATVTTGPVLWSVTVVGFKKYR